MSWIDWMVLGGTLLLIIVYGIYKTRSNKNLDSYLLGNQSMPWYRVGFSIMATQASAITFLSAPGQAYSDGMRFVQFYFGLPLAMIVICIFFLPVYHKLRVFTAYEYLEQRFDLKTRSLTALLFLTQRGLAAGITIYAPSIVLSSLLGWNIYWTNIFMGGLVITYTMSGGTRAVSITQLQQLMVIFIGMFIAGFMAVKLLPEGIGLTDALMVAGKMGRTNVITTDFNWNDRYNIWSGLIGGFFLALSYFGTDQSQVGRYLSGKSVAQSRIGLLMNGMLKIPMQFLILMIGALIFAFYQFNPSPIFFNDKEVEKVLASPQSDKFSEITHEYDALAAEKRRHAFAIIDGLKNGNEARVDESEKELQMVNEKGKALRTEAIAVIKDASPSAETNDTNYIFLTFVLHSQKKMNSSHFILCCSMSAFFHSQAQEKVVVFQNIFSGKKVELKAGDEVHMRFTVHDTADAPLDIAISDVTLFGSIEGVDDSSLVLVSKNKTFDRISLSVPVNSIEAFRKYSPLRPALKAASTIVATASGLLVSLQISNSDEIFSWQNAGFAVGTVSAVYMSKQLFSDKMEYFMVEGWRGKVMKKMAKHKT